ncbi:DEAD-domain-containing protein [Phellopilus nigrolimitatus]|nr:DEAD-domain-containing protein [Phellopilus nigrolimitatus]
MTNILPRGLRAWCAPAFRISSARTSVTHHRRWLSTTLPRPAYAAEAQRQVEVESGSLLEKSSLSSQAAQEKLEEGVSFSSLKNVISRGTLEAITVRPMQLKHMTPVQEAVLSMLPQLAESHENISEESGAQAAPRDLMVRARTGTGKTLAFLVPAIESRLKAIEEAGKQALIDAGLTSDKDLERRAKRLFAQTQVGTLILSPTRELAAQIASEAIRLTTHHDGFQVHMLTGGNSKRMQMRDWSRGRLDIVVSTTGRLRDVLNTEPEVGKALLGTKILVLDEADTMLDMGFREDIDAIVEHLPPAPQRQTFVFSATINKSIEQIARRTLSKNNAYINTVPEDASPVHAHVPQYHTVLPSASEQLPHVLRLLAHDQLSNPSQSKAIVFLPTTKMTQLYASLLREVSRSVLPAGRDTRIYELHSKRTMGSRTSTSDSFRKDKSGASVLVTSDVSARGVDYPGVTRVIQVGIPSTTDQYVHRVGRTGRTGGMVGRGDLVLLPWELGFVTWQLTEVPMKPVTTVELSKQLAELAERHDENPTAFFPVKSQSTNDRYDRRSAPVTFKGPLAPRLQALSDEVKQLISTIDEEAVSDTFASMLGYYVMKASELRVAKEAVLEGCRDWTVQACGLARAPYVSASLLQKVGITGGQGGKFGGGRSPSGNSWAGRENTRPRRDRDASTGADGFSSRSRGGWRDERSQGEFKGYQERRERPQGEFRERRERPQGEFRERRERPQGEFRERRDRGGFGGGYDDRS